MSGGIVPGLPPLTSYIDHLLGRRGPSGFGSGATVYEVANTFSSNIQGKIVVITGANSGSGKELTLACCRHHAEVVMICRDRDEMHEVAEEARKQNPAAKVHEVYCRDISSMRAVRDCVETFKDLDLPRVDRLFNHAGVFAMPFTLSEDGWEMHWAANFVGHFLLTNLLAGYLTKAPDARVVNTGSEIHRYCPSGGIDWGMLSNPQRYNRFKAYGQANVAKMLHAYELDRLCRRAGLNVMALSAHPGVVHTKTVKQFSLSVLIRPFAGCLQKNAQQGAATLAYCGFADDVKGGHYYADCNEMTPSEWALNKDLAHKVWSWATSATSSDFFQEQKSDKSEEGNPAASA